MLAVLIGIVVVIVAVVEWFGHITVIHAIAILTLILGISVILGALQGDRYHTRLLRGMPPRLMVHGLADLQLTWQGYPR